MRRSSPFLAANKCSLTYLARKTRLLARHWLQMFAVAVFRDAVKSTCTMLRRRYFPSENQAEWETRTLPRTIVTGYEEKEQRVRDIVSVNPSISLCRA